MDKLACLVLTCSDPKYSVRRMNQETTHKKLQEIGFDVFILLHKPNIESIQVEGNILYSPIPEDYEYIPLRLWSAYEYLSTKHYTHILKLDDDIQILAENDFLKGVFFYCLQYEYIAFKGIKDDYKERGEGAMVMNGYHWNKCKNYLLNHTYSCYPAISYAGGPFYMISTRVLRQCKQSDFEKSLYEDVCLGIISKKYGINLFDATHLLQDTIISDNTKDTFKLYYFFNPVAYSDIINS